MIQYLNQHKPQIVHFSGHGSQTGEIILVDSSGSPKPVSPRAIKALFTTLRDNIQLVVLNACYSRLQAEAIIEIIDCVIGMNDTIGDRAATIFAASFYRAIGFGRSVQEAFDQGKAALLLEGIPEESTPELVVKAGVDPSLKYIAAISRPRRSITTSPQDLFTAVINGMPVFDDPLIDNTRGNGWNTESGKNCRVWFAEGAFHLSTSRRNFNFYSEALPSFTDFAYQVQMTIIQGQAGGIIFRADETNSLKFYLFRVGQDGSYVLLKYIDELGEHARTLARGSTSLFTRGLGQPNLVAVIAYDNKFYFYINKQFCASAEDDTYSTGQIGVVAYTGNQKQVEVVFSNAQVWKL
ncbi:MAG: hypothetical protein NVSMB38_17290 [Ktedonobacteraceae bacterium]